MSSVPSQEIDWDSVTWFRPDPSEPEAVLEALREAQARQGFLTPAAIEAVAAALHLPPSQVYGVATFYSLLQVASAPRASAAIPIQSALMHFAAAFAGVTPDNSPGDQDGAPSAGLAADPITAV